MKKFLIVLGLTLALIVPSYAAVISESDIPTVPCISVDEQIAEIIAAVPDTVAVETGNFITFSSPTRDSDLRMGFDENRCLNYSALLSKGPGA